MEKKLVSSYLEFLVIFVLCCIYFVGVMNLARLSLAFEITFCLLLPIIVYSSRHFDKQSVHSRILQLLFIETFFLLIVLSSKVSLRLELDSWSNVLNYGFLVFFFGQTLLFVIYQFKVKAFLGVFRSLMLFTMLIIWFSGAPNEVYQDSEGRFLFWGGDAPWAIQIYYCFWVACVLLVDSVLLPNYRQVFPHAASVFVSLFSGEFFHVRLLTACHLFVLDLFFSYTDKKSLSSSGSNICIVSDDQQKWYDNNVRSLVSRVATFFCFVIFIYFVVAN